MEESVKKTALVTGGARGIGRAIVLRFASEGYNVVINYNGSHDAAEKTRAEAEQYGVSAMTYQADVSSYDSVKGMMDAVMEKFGRLDVLVNNSGITKDGLLLRMTPENFGRVIDVNLTGAFNCIQTASRIMMRQRSGSIISLSSVVGIVGNAGQANYAASKAGIIGLTKSAAKELALRGIRVNAIAPGFIETDMTASLRDADKEKMLAAIPLRKFGRPEQVADVCAALASDAFSYVTGQVIHVDGGMVM